MNHFVTYIQLSIFTIPNTNVCTHTKYYFTCPLSSLVKPLVLFIIILLLHRTYGLYRYLKIYKNLPTLKFSWKSLWLEIHKDKAQHAQELLLTNGFTLVYRIMRLIKAQISMSQWLERYHRGNLAELVSSCKYGLSSVWKGLWCDACLINVISYTGTVNNRVGKSLWPG